jgi:hypothetical protein
LLKRTEDKTKLAAAPGKQKLTYQSLYTRSENAWPLLFARAILCFLSKLSLILEHPYFILSANTQIDEWQLPHIQWFMTTSVGVSGIEFIKGNARAAVSQYSKQSSPNAS